MGYQLTLSKKKCNKVGYCSADGESKSGEYWEKGGALMHDARSIQDN